jgi:hypothetical protein
VRALPQQVTSVEWEGNATDYLEPDYYGKDSWEPDQPIKHGYNADLLQELNEPAIFHIDAPGSPELERGSDLRYTRVDKFRHWVEVQIAGQWYACSDYLQWRNIMHLQCTGPGTPWAPIPSMSNDILEGWLGSMQGFAEDFSDNPQ